MKKTLTFLLAFILPLLVNAEALSRQEAQKLAHDFLTNKGVSISRNMEIAYQARFHKAPTADKASYYIFNNGTGNGFVIVAGDDNVEPILGYSTTGSFDENNIPANMKAWLETYEEQIALVAEGKVSNSQPLRSGVMREAIAPLVTATWGQGAPYNSQCPVLGSNTDPCVTGCVATAMAQIMYYHKWPETTTAIIPQYNIEYQNIGIQSFGPLDITSFQWHDMQPDYNGSENDNQKNAVAELMKYCGYSVEMSYGPGSSGAFSSNCVKAFKEYFGYDSHLHEITRNNVSASEWENVIYNELSNGRPVLYSAVNASEGGHAFVCDGYDGELFHINWGWNGMSDGYFRLQALNPNDQGIGGSSSSSGYSRAQSAIIGIQKPVSHPEGTPSEKLQTLSLKPLAGSTKAKCRLSYSIMNVSDVPCSYDWGVGIYSGENLKATIPISSYDFDLFESASWSFWFDFSSSLPDGTYTIKGISRITDTPDWFVNDGSDKHYVTAVISGDELTLTANAKATLAVTAVEPQTDLIKGETAAIKVTVANSGNADYLGDLWFFVNGTAVTGEGANIPAGGSDYVDYRVLFTTAGTNQIKICTDIEGTDVIYSGTVDVSNEVENSSTFELSSVNFDNDVLNYLYKEGIVSGTVTVRNTGFTRYNGNIYIMMTNTTGGYIYSYRLGNSHYIEAGATKEIPFSINNNEKIKYGSVIKVYAGLKESFETSDYFGSSDSYTIKNVVPAWNGAGGLVAMDRATPTVPEDITAVDFRVTDAIGSIALNSNPNTIFYLKEDAIIPAELENSIVVKSGNAVKDVTLVDGKNLYIPEDFVAGNISYKRTPSIYADGTNGWETIVLPFDVEEVTADGGQIDWFHSSIDTNKDFWLKEFVGVSGTTLLYDHVYEWKANTPYIIALPGNKWGNEHDLTGKEIAFNGTDVEVKATKNMITENGGYTFTGTTLNGTLEHVYSLNPEGNRFNYSASLTSMPFRAYFSTDSSEATSLGIGSGEFTGMDIVEEDADNTELNVYTLGGQKVKTINAKNGKSQISGMNKGIYIIGNKKVIIK